MRLSALLLAALVLSGCAAAGGGAGSSGGTGSTGGTGGTAPRTPAASESAQKLPDYKPLQPVEKAARGYVFKIPGDWVYQVASGDTDLYSFGAVPGVGSASFTFGKLDPGGAAERYQVPQPFDPARVRDAWLARQKKDTLHQWQVREQRDASAAAGLKGYRIALEGGNDRYRTDNVTYLLVGPETILVLSVQEETSRAMFNAGRWKAIGGALDALIDTLQEAPKSK